MSKFDTFGKWKSGWDVLGSVFDPIGIFGGQTLLGSGGVGQAMGDTAKQIDPSAPGATVDTSQADTQRANMESLISSLQQQAATGNGAWQKSFAQAVQQARGNASALGQDADSQARSGYAGALRNIGNAQSSIGQRAVGQESVLRNQSETDAQNQLAQLLNSQGQGDIAQSANAAAVAQANRQANVALAEQAKQNQQDTMSSAGSVLGSIVGIAKGHSRGGHVPGRARVFGDDERNDTVPAMLSPGEIVVPRTKASNPKAAAAFARAVAMRHGRHMADGGSTGISDVEPNEGNRALMTFLPHIGDQAYFNQLTGPQAASIQNGGLLNTAPYGQTRSQMDTLAGQFGARAAGDNSIAGTISQQQNDAAFANAVREQQARHAVAGDVLQANAEQGVNAAGAAGARRGNEQSAGQHALGDFATNRRAQEMAFAKAQQQAAMNNTMLNAGLTLQNQAAIRNAVASAGQAAAALAAAGKGGQQPYTAPGTLFDVRDAPGEQNTHDFNENLQPESAPGDYPTPDVGAGEGAAHGGRIAGYAGGGTIRRDQDENAAAMRRLMAAIEKGRRSGHHAAAAAPRKASAAELERERADAKADPYAPQTFEVYAPEKSTGAGSIAWPEYSKVQISANPATVLPLGAWTALNRSTPSAMVPPIPPAGIVARGPAGEVLGPVRWPPPETTPEPSAPPRPRFDPQLLALQRAAGTPGNGMLDTRYPQEAPEEPAIIATRKAHGGKIPGHIGAIPRYADGGAIDPRWLNLPGGAAPTQSLPPATDPSAEQAAEPLASLPQNRYPPPAGSSSAPAMTPVEQQVSERMAHPVTLDQEQAEKALRARADREASGIEPETAPDTAVKPSSIAQPAAKPVARVGAPADKPIDTSAFDSEAEAIRQQGAFKEQQARSEANALSAYHDELSRHAADQQDQLKRAHEDASALMGRYNTAVDEMKRIDTSVDPGRFWASRSTGQKVMGIIGMALSALGSRDGTNKAAELLGQAVDRDLDAQKVDVAARLRKGEGALSAAQNAYGMNRQLFQDDLAATAATKASMLELADNQLKQIAATYASPMAKQQAAQLSAQLQASKQKFIQQAQAQTVENGLKRAETAKNYAEAGKAASVGAGGLSNEEKSKMFDVRSTSENVRRNIAKARELISRNGTFELTGPEGTELNSALGEAAQDWARMRDPGSTVREAELENAQRQLGIKGGELLTSNKTALKLLDNFERGLDQREGIAYRARGLPVPDELMRRLTTRTQ